MVDFTIWTDGGCAKNPNGKGGYGVVIENADTKHIETYSQGFLSSTNNRMEVRAIIRALEETPDDTSLLIYSDSKYAVMTFNGNYQKKKNKDLWNIADALIARKKNVMFEWVKGHADNDNNNLCDSMATEAMKSDDLIVDEGFVTIPVKTANKTTTTSDNDILDNKNDLTDLYVEPMIPDAIVNKDCYDAICKINATEKPSFHDFSHLRSGGKDFWSMQPIDALTFYFGAYLVSYVSDYFDNDEHKILSAIRWHGRGLTIENAIRKVVVDNVIANNVSAKN